MDPDQIGASEMDWRQQNIEMADWIVRQQIRGFKSDISLRETVKSQFIMNSKSKMPIWIPDGMRRHTCLVMAPHIGT